MSISCPYNEYNYTNLLKSDLNYIHIIGVHCSINHHVTDKYKYKTNL